MGLLPAIFRDIAWPERRILPVTQPPSLPVELIIRAIGLVPETTGSRDRTRDVGIASSAVVRWAWGKSPQGLRLLTGVFAELLVASYAAIAIMEVYSKRSMLGCPFPLFVLMWYLVALVPASLHTGFSRWRKRGESGHGGRKVASNAPTPSLRATETQTPQQGYHFSPTEMPSAVQGIDEAWLVQLCWAIYYIAGTLIFTSIAAVTVIELVVWVVLGFAVTGTGKLMAIFMVVKSEKTKI